MDRPTIDLTINKKCIVAFVDGAIKFSTRSKERKYFTIPHDDMVNRKLSSIKQSEAHEEMAVTYTINHNCYRRIKDTLSVMDNKNLIMPKNQ